MVQPYLLNLMQCPALPRMKIGPEGLVCIEFANILRGLTLEGKLNAIWCHIPNEGRRSPMLGAKLKAEGLIVGVADYLFAGGGNVGFIEFKSRKGRQTPAQIDFARWCAVTHCRYAVCRSAQQGIDTLRNWGFIL